VVQVDDAAAMQDGGGVEDVISAIDTAAVAAKMMRKIRER